MTSYKTQHQLTYISIDVFDSLTHIRVCVQYLVLLLGKISSAHVIDNV